MTARNSLVHVVFVLAVSGFVVQHLVVADGGSAREFNPVHHCNGCHGTEGPSGDPTLGGPAAIELLCLTCHGPGGESMLTAGVHETSAGTMTCMDCHNPHIDPDNWLGGVNLKLIGTIDYDLWPWTAKINSPNSGLREVVFESYGVDAGEPSLHSFADNDEDGNGYFDGVCETCHTQTAHHRNNAPDPGHNVGNSCNSCHGHAGGFEAEGGSCTDCHSTVQDNGDGVPVGGRRAVVGEFPTSDAHAHFGGTDVSSAACTVCHDQLTHMDGYVDLADPDTGALYTFIHAADLTADPDLSNFCANCHDADGAARLGTPLDPFGDGTVPADVAVQFQGTLQWYEEYGDFCFGTEGTLRGVNSHHDISDVDQAFSGAAVECLNCHGAHASSATQPVADPAFTTTAWAGTDNGFCLSCHEGGAGPIDPMFPVDAAGVAPAIVGPSIALRGIDSCSYTDAMWYVDYSWTNSAHGLDSKREWAGYSGAPGHEMDCKDCHDPHGSYTATNTLGNPYMIRDVVDGTMYEDDGVRPGAQWTGPPWDTFGVVRSDVVVSISGTTVDWGSSTSLCSACHADWLAAYDWHSYCDGCQSCHAHGMAWGEHDWGDAPLDNTACPLPLRGRGDGKALPPLHIGADVQIPPHFRRIEQVK